MKGKRKSFALKIAVAFASMSILWRDPHEDLYAAFRWPEAYKERLSLYKDHDKYDFAETSSAKSFVQQYDSIDELEFRQIETRRISVNIKHSKMGGLWNTHIYDSLSKKHNDLSFYGKINVGKTSHCNRNRLSENRNLLQQRLQCRASCRNITQRYSSPDFWHSTSFYKVGLQEDFQQKWTSFRPLRRRRQNLLRKSNNEILICI